MAILDDATKTDVAFWEKAIAKRWFKVLNVLLEESDEDAMRLITTAEAILERFAGGSREA